MRADEERSSSSTAFSSIRSELVEMLPRRGPNWAGLVGEVPERPSVVIERRRRGSAIGGAGFMGPGKAGVPVEPEPLRWNRPVKAPEVTELRRWRGMSEGLLELSPDMVKKRGSLEEARKALGCIYVPLAPSRGYLSTKGKVVCSGTVSGSMLV